MLDLMNRNEKRGVAVLTSQEIRRLKHANFDIGTDVYFIKYHIESMELLVESMTNEHDKEALTLMIKRMKEHTNHAIKRHDKIDDILR